MARGKKRLEPVVEILSDKEVDDWIAQAKKQWIKCRIKGHRDLAPWTARYVRIPTRPQVRIVEKERCKCGAIKVTFYNARAHIIDSRYDYSQAPGYLVEKGQGRIAGEARDHLRMFFLESRGILPESEDDEAAS